MKTAIVTGAGSGIGRAVAVALSRDHRVALLGRRRARLEETAALCSQPCLVLPTDVADPASVMAAFGSVETSWGRIDLLFNNAGTGVPGTTLLEDVSVSQWRQVVDVNLSGMFYCVQEAFRVMKAQSPKGGRIINNGSISAQLPRPNSAPYSATKHAITGLTRSAALDGRAHNIAVGQIDIGNAGTDMTRTMPTGMPQADGSIRPEPVMDVHHVASAVAFMASLPLDANVFTMTIMATGMPFAGRG